ncbi:MAG: hypothetical protein NXI12_10760 [Alphaproteobacteria bacterium]|nr:hypothetical protein [Alphaproteobacteria bacterium]
MLELTLLLLAGAGMLFFLLRPRRQASVDKAAEAARRAVEARVAKRDTDDKAR